MTENKQFTVPVKYSLSHSKIQCDGIPLTNDELVRILNTNNEVFLEYFKLKEEHNELKEVNEWLKKSIKRQQLSNEESSKYIEEVVKENEQLKSAYMEMEDYLGRLEEQIIEVRKNDGL